MHQNPRKVEAQVLYLTPAVWDRLLSLAVFDGKDIEDTIVMLLNLHDHFWRNYDVIGPALEKKEEKCKIRKSKVEDADDITDLMD